MTWDDYQEIGRALCQAYPHVNRMTVSDEELIRLVVTLPGFSGAATPKNWRDIAAVHFAWIAAAEGPDDSSDWEGMA